MARKQALWIIEQNARFLNRLSDLVLCFLTLNFFPKTVFYFSEIALVLFIVLTGQIGATGWAQERPFQVERVAEFHYPWGLAFLPDGRMLVGEKHRGTLFLVDRQGQKTPVIHVPKIAGQGQNGLLGLAIAPDFDNNRQIYFSYIEEASQETRLVLARAILAEEAGGAALENITILWRQMPAGGGGQPGGVIAFDPQGQHLYLTVGDRMRPDSAQDPDQARGLIIRLNLDGTTPTDNPYIDQDGSHATEGNIRSQTWTSGHRNPYGLAFDPDGRLWSHEMGPRGGDELNLIEAGKNYGWPLVSNGNNYNFIPIPDHATRPEFAAPIISWTPVISPSGLIFYDGAMFANWRGAALIGGLSSQALIEVQFYDKNAAREQARWPMGARIRNVAQAPDGSVWLVEDGAQGGLLRLTASP